MGAQVKRSQEPKEVDTELYTLKLISNDGVSKKVKLLGVPNWTNDLNFDDLKGKSQKSSEKPS